MIISSDITDITDLEFEVKEEYANQFNSNPIKFIQENFNFKSLNLYDFQEVDVVFVNRKGKLKATYDEKGELVRTSQRFKNIALPLAVRQQLYDENKGWSMVKNIYTASGKSHLIEQELYRIKLVNGKEVRRVKLVPVPVPGGRVASN